MDLRKTTRPTGCAATSRSRSSAPGPSSTAPSTCSSSAPVSRALGRVPPRRPRRAGRCRRRGRPGERGERTERRQLRARARELRRRVPRARAGASEVHPRDGWRRVRRGTSRVGGARADAAEPAADAGARRVAADRLRLLPGRLALHRHDEEVERGLLEEAPFVERHGASVELWAPERVRYELGFVTRHRSRFLPDDGSYHPFKYACGLLDTRRRARRRAVHAPPRAPARRRRDDGRGKHRRAKRRRRDECLHARAAAGCRSSIPEPGDGHRGRRGQARGRIVTSEEGPVYFNQPRGGLRDWRAPLVLGAATTGRSKTRARAAARRPCTGCC